MTSSSDALQITTLDPANFRHMPWKNGGGVTIDIAVAMLPGFAAGGWDGIIWRFSRTAIVTPGAFSDLSGYDRELALVSGAGLVLETADGEIDVRLPFQPVRFAGETKIISRLEAGAVEVVNLIGDRSRVSIELSCLWGGVEIACLAGVHILYAAASCTVAVDGKLGAITAGHALRIDAGAEFRVTSGFGTIVIASVIPATPTSA
jgi:uncharacterized protein